MGTRRRFFLPLFDRAFITSSVCGLSHGRGPTLGERGMEIVERRDLIRHKLMNLVGGGGGGGGGVDQKEKSKVKNFVDRSCKPSRSFLH